MPVVAFEEPSEYKGPPSVPGGLFERLSGSTLASDPSEPPCSPSILRSAISLLDPLIHRLHNSGVDRGYDVHRSVQLLFRHTSLPCVRKAPFYSGLAVAGHGDRQPQKHLLPVCQTGDVMGLTIKQTKIRSLRQFTLLPFLSHRRSPQTGYFRKRQRLRISSNALSLLYSSLNPKGLILTFTLRSRHSSRKRR